jgi:hypothetical protein
MRWTICIIPGVLIAAALAVATRYGHTPLHPAAEPLAEAVTNAGLPPQAPALVDGAALQEGTGTGVAAVAAAQHSNSGNTGAVSESAAFLRAGPKPGALRDFILSARAMPGEGGIFYASRIAEACGRLTALASFAPRLAADPASAPTDVHRSSALGASVADAVARHWLDGCRQISPDELRDWKVLDKRSALRASAISADPLVRTAAQFLDGLPANDRAAFEDAGLNILRSADPGLLDQLGPRVLLRRDSQGMYIYFRSRIGVMANPDILAAVELLPCELGLPCGPLDEKVGAACLAAIGECFADRYAWVQAHQLGGDPSRLNAAVVSARDMAQALRAGRYDLFVPPSR